MTRDKLVTFVKKNGWLAIVGVIVTILSFLFPDCGKLLISGLFQQPISTLQIFLSVITISILIKYIHAYQQIGSEKDKIDKLLTSLKNCQESIQSSNTDNNALLHKHLDDLQNICGRCDNIKGYYDINITHGIKTIRTRDYYSHDFFKSLYRNSFKELTISGHSLNNTINKDRRPDLRNEFRDAIVRIITNNGSVKILLMSVDDDNPNSKRIAFMTFVEEIKQQIIYMNYPKPIDEIMSSSLLIKEVKYLPYYIVQNENTSLIAHYKMKGDKNIYTIDVNRDLGYGQCYISDFEYIFNEVATAVNIK